MNNRTTGEWPYHQSRNGDWVKCQSNPCRRHSGGDIMATSPEDAYAKADKGSDGTSGLAAKGGDRKARAAKRSHYNPLVEEKSPGRRVRYRRRVNPMIREHTTETLADHLNFGDAMVTMGDDLMVTRYVFNNSNDYGYESIIYKPSNPNDGLNTSGADRKMTPVMKSKGLFPDSGSGLSWALGGGKDGVPITDKDLKDNKPTPSE